MKQSDESIFGDYLHNAKLWSLKYRLLLGMEISDGQIFLFLL
jgi:hypothetical protein